MKIDWRDFFANNINGYLLSDLHEMDKIHVNGAGNCGYPMLMTMLSGMELLGGLTTRDTVWMRSKNEDYFKNFYKQYFQKQNKCYEEKGLWHEFYNLLRHKLAHTFLTAFKYVVAKGSQRIPVEHKNEFTAVDVSLMLKDFKGAIAALEKDLGTNEELAQRFQAHLSEMIEDYGPIPSGYSRASMLFSQPSGVSLSAIVSPESSKFTSLTTTAMPIKFDDLDIITTRKKRQNDNLEEET